MCVIHVCHACVVMHGCSNCHEIFQFILTTPHQCFHFNGRLMVTALTANPSRLVLNFESEVSDLTRHTEDVKKMVSSFTAMNLAQLE